MFTKYVSWLFKAILPRQVDHLLFITKINIGIETIAKQTSWSRFFLVPSLTRAKSGMYLAVLFYYPGKKNFAFFFAPGFNRLNKFLPEHKVWMTAAEWGVGVTANHVRCLHDIWQFQ